MSKLVRSSTIVAFLALGLAACSDGLTAPQQSSGFDPGEALLAKGSSVSSGRGNSGRGQTEGSRTFTIYPWLPVLEKFGDHTLTMPANVVCDPVKSSYGSAYWDTPCPRTMRPITVTATWGFSNGQPVISFSPDLRFAPSSNEDRWVELTLRDPRGLKPEMYYTILWFDEAANRWVDESQADPTLKARNIAGNLVARRLKHFSYYSLWVGLGSYNVTSGMGGDVRDMGGW